MLKSTELFLAPLEKWVQAVRSGDFETAKHQAQFLTKAGELLVIHPDFERCFKEHCNGFDPKDALIHLCQFLMCATAGRARVLKQ